MLERGGEELRDGCLNCEAVPAAELLAGRAGAEGIAEMLLPLADEGDFSDVNLCIIEICVRILGVLRISAVLLCRSLPLRRSPTASRCTRSR